jgi:hypothetical protein
VTDRRASSRPTAGRWWSASRSTSSWPPPPSCSAAAPTASATSPTPTSTRCASACPARCRCSTARRSSWPCARPGAQLHRPAVHVSPARTTSTRTCRRLPDQPVRPAANVDGWLDLPDGTRSASSAPTSRRTPASPPTSGGTGGRIHGADASLVDYNRAGVPLVEIVGRPDIRTPSRPGLRGRAARHPVAIGASDAKMEEGSMRVDANVSRCAGPASRRHPLRDQEPQLGALARPGHRVRGPPPGRPARGRRADPPGDPPLGRGRRPHPHVRSKEEADDYRYFPSPTWCRSSPIRSGSSRSRGTAAAAGRAAPAWPRPRARRRRRGR